MEQGGRIMPDIVQLGPNKFFMNPPVTPGASQGIAIPNLTSDAQATEIPKPAANFDVQGAIKDGIAPNLIAQHLSEQAGFDYNSARKDNIPDSQIIEHLTGQQISAPEGLGTTPPQIGTQPTFYQKLEQALSPSTEYFNQSPMQNIIEAPRGAVEAGASMLTGIPAMMAGVGARAITAPFIGTKKAEEVKNWIGETFTYQPQTEIGKYGTKLLASPFTTGVMAAEEYGGYPGKVAAETIGASLPLRAMMIPPGSVKSALQTVRGKPYTSEQLNAYQIARENKLPVSPSSIKPTMSAKVIEGMIGDVPLINRLTQKYRGQVVDVVKGRAKAILDQYASPEAIASMDARIEGLYNDAFNNIKSPTVSIKDTLKYIKKLDEKNALTKQGKGILAELEQLAGDKSEIPVERLPQLKKQMGSLGKGDTKKVINRKILEDLSESDGGKTAAEALIEIDAQYMYLAKSKRINRLFNDSVKDGYFQPDTFLMKYRNIKNELTKQVPEAAAALNELVGIVQVAKKDINTYNKFDKQAAFWNPASIATGVGGLIASPHIAIPAAAALTGLTKSTMNPTGIMKNILLRGKK